MGPILAAVIALTATNPASGSIYMLAYVIGFALPFLVMTFFIGKISWIQKHNRVIMKIGGYLMIFVGILLFLIG